MIKQYITLAVIAAALTLPAFGADNPNVVIIYGDDVGYADVGAYGAKLIPTPHLDKLAEESLVFTDAHCSAATCTPSRFSLLTGRMGFRNGARILPPGAPLIIPTNIPTMPKMFKKAGYITGVVGKWHLGLGKKGTPVDWNGEVKPGPLEVGFEYSFLLPSTNDRVPCVYLENYKVVNLEPKDPLFVGKKPPADTKSTVYPDGKKNREAMTYYPSSHGHNHSVINGIGRIGYMWGGKTALWDDETMADEFVKQAKKFIAANKAKPFFLYFASQDIHVPRVPHPRFKGKSKLSYRGDAMVQLDWSTGEILKALDENGLKENTIVIFSSDNGPVYDDGYRDGCKVKPRGGEVDRGHDASGPYRGGKYQIYEGGTRVPLIVRWPARIKPGKSEAMISQVDFMASFAKLLGQELADDAGIDSQEALKAFLGEDKVGMTYILEEAGGTIALRKGNWKIVAGMKGKGGKKGPKLFDLKTDIEEKTDVAAKNPEMLKKLAETLTKIRKGKGLRHEELK